MNQKFEPYVSLNAVAEYLGVTERTIRNWINDGKIPAYQMGVRSPLRFRLSEIDAAVQRIEPASA